MNKNLFVNVRQGILLGIQVTDYTGSGKFIAFRGIPYAKPPIGELRFKDPEPVEPWSDVRDCTKYGHIALQYHNLAKRSVGNEDCLNLNVYTKDIDLQTKRAVMVWIHGGFFEYGTCNHDIYGPDYLILKDVILVTINFRLGALGFLNLDNEMAPGNQGLKDVLMALKWVHDNISQFGGNPENVTIFGQGSGGVMVHFLAVCPQADGLFHKAISQSGTAAITMAFSEKKTQMSRSARLVVNLGRQITNTKDAVRFLRSIDAQDIIMATLDILKISDNQQRILPFGPTVDCDSSNPFFVEHPAIMLRRGVRVPFIIGFTTNEGTVFGGDLDEKVLEEVNSDFASIIHPSIWPTLEQKSMTVEDVRVKYFGKNPVSIETIENYIDLLGDMHFYRGIFETICIQAQLGHRSTYVYKFSYEPECSLPKLLMDLDVTGSYHGEEVSYLLHPRIPKRPFYSMLGLKLKDPMRKKIAECITQMWTDFAKTGNPTPAITALIPIKWTPLEKEEEFQILNINETVEMYTMQKIELIRSSLM